jgi:transposase
MNQKREYFKESIKRNREHDQRRNTMSLHAHPIDPIPAWTQRIAKTSFPKGTLAMHIRDEIGSIYQDEDFADLFPRRGRAAEAPWRLALVTVLQMGEHLSDKQAAEMVRGRIDWKYALSLPLDDLGFDASILGDFRQRLVDHHAQERLLEPILQICRARGWLVQGGTQRIDSTMVLGHARRLHSLETVGETMRDALNTWAEQEPEWLLQIISLDWFDRYVHRFELQRFPKGTHAQQRLITQVGEDAWTLLEATRRDQAPQTVKNSELEHLLQQVWSQHYEMREGSIHWRDGPLVTNAFRVVTPYDQEIRESRKRQTEWAGYKVHLAETCNEEDVVHVITHAKVSEATTTDVSETKSLLDDLQKKGLAPERVLLDSGYLSGDIIVQQEEHGQKLIGPVLLDPTWQHKIGMGIEAFEIHWDEREAWCPRGERSTKWVKGTGNRGEETVHVYFAPEVCQRCERKKHCTKSEKGGRTITLYPRKIHETLQERRKEQQEEAFKNEYAQRSGREGTISEGVRKHGMRRSRYKGKEKTQLQMTAIAAAMNISRIETALRRQEAGLAPRRQRALSAFARLKERVTV